MEGGRPCIALVPARDFRAGKSRLAGALSDEARTGLGRWMLERVLDALDAAGGVDETAVLSDGAAVLALAESRGAEGLNCPARDLNADLEAGRRWALEKNAGTILIVPADLPALGAPDIEAMIALAGESRPGDSRAGGCAVMAPSPDGGTNGLLLRPPGGLPFSFGRGSYARHRGAALAGGLGLIPFENAGFALDVDSPSDLASLAERDVPVPEWLAAITPA